MLCLETKFSQSLWKFYYASAYSMKNNLWSSNSKTHKSDFAYTSSLNPENRVKLLQNFGLCFSISKKIYDIFLSCLCTSMYLSPFPLLNILQYYTKKVVDFMLLDAVQSQVACQWREKKNSDISFRLVNRFIVNDFLMLPILV